VPVPDDYPLDTGDVKGIYTGANGICDTTANDDDIGCIPGFTSGLQEYLNNTVFNQCVTSFTVSSATLQQVNYDLDRNGVLTYESEEHQAIINGAKKTDFDYNVFVVADIDDYDGFADMPGHYSWVEWDVIQRTVAHELAHNVGGIDNVGDGPDFDNLMHAGVGWRLRYYQWDECNPRKNPGQY